MEKSKNLVLEIVDFLEKNVSSASERAIVKQLKSISLVSKVSLKKNNIVPKEEALEKALSTISKNSLLSIKQSIYMASNEMYWRTDSGLFYEAGSGISEQYLNGNMHTELIGPINGSFKSKELRLGLFLLEPQIFYTDHKHEAPELYLNLTNDTDWRFERGKWQRKNCGSIVYNPPFKVHAMKTNSLPFLSVWCWPTNSKKKCVVVNHYCRDEINCT